MAKEIVDSVIKAESDAQKAEEAAAAQKEEILREARQQAKETSSARLKAAEAAAAALLARAGQEGKEDQDGILSQARAEISELRGKALSRQDGAVKMILSELI